MNRPVFTIILSVFFILLISNNSFAQEFVPMLTSNGSLYVAISIEPQNPTQDESSTLQINFINPETNQIQEHIDYKVTITKDGADFDSIPLTHTSVGSVTIPVEFTESGQYEITVDVEGILFKPITPESVTFTKTVSAISSNNSATDQSPENKMFPSSIGGTDSSYYSNSLYGFSIDYPQNWFPQENVELIGGENAALVSFVSDKYNAKYTPNFFILYRNLGQPYVDLLRSYSDQEVLDQYSAGLISDNAKILNKSIKSYSDGYRMDFELVQTMKINDKDFATLHRELVFFLLKGGEQYSLVFAASPEDFDTSVLEFRKSADTFYVGPSHSVKAISGKYANTDPNFEFDILQGYAGFPTETTFKLLIMPVASQKINGLPEFTIFLSIQDPSSLAPTSTTPEKPDEHKCNTSINYKLINRLQTREQITSCDDTKIKAYQFATTGNKFINIGYLAQQPSDTKKEADFEKIVSTLKVENTFPVKEKWRNANGFGAYQQQITIGDHSSTIKYHSNSQVTNFTFDPQNKRFSFSVSESDNSGSTIIPASKIIEGPYTVTVDGKTIATDLTEDYIEGITEVSADYQKGAHTITIEGKQLASENTVPNKPVCGTGTVEKDGVCVPAKQQKASDSQGGGCLIATATYETELAPQVQLLREIRDHTLLQTSSGSSFMTSFNAIYYSFSPTVADLERQNPIFKESVKVAITPMLSTLSILNYVNIDSEQQMLGYGISIILLNVGIYFAIPALILIKIKNSKLIKM